MLITANGKNIDTLPFQHLFVQGEKCSEKIAFRIPRYYNETDLSLCVFIIKGVNEKDELAEQVLNVSVNATSLELEWIVSSLFTTASGKLELEIQALSSVDGTLTYLLKYVLPPVYIKEAVNGENVPVPDVSEQVVTQINTVIADGITTINNKIDSFDTTTIENRLTNAENEIETLKSKISIEVMTDEEYSIGPHSSDVLYVIV